MALRRALAALAPMYERQWRRPVAIECVGGVDAARRVDAGEAFDFVVLAAPAIDALAAAGRVDARSRMDLARSEIAVAVKAGARRPDVSSASAVRDAIRDARAIGYSTGPSGTQLARLLEDWNLARTIAPRMVQAPPGVPVAELLARGEVEIGLQQLSELIGTPGVEVVGTLPPEIQQVTVFRAAVCSAARDVEGARAFLAFAASPRVDAIKQQYGLAPV